MCSAQCFSAHPVSNRHPVSRMIVCCTPLLPGSRVPYPKSHGILLDGIWDLIVDDHLRGKMIILGGRWSSFSPGWSSSESLDFPCFRPLLQGGDDQDDHHFAHHPWQGTFLISHISWDTARLNLRSDYRWSLGDLIWTMSFYHFISFVYVIGFFCTE